MSKTILKEFEISGAVDEWITKSINAGLSLMKMIEKRKDIVSAKKYTFWAPKFSLDNVKSFEDYLNIPEVASTDPWIYDKIVKFLNAGNNRIAVFEDWIIDTSDDYADYPEGAPFFSSTIKRWDGNEVYFFVDAAIAKEKLLLAMHDAGHAGPYLCGALIDLPENVKIENKSVVDKNVLELMADNTKYLVFAAFDQEGYIFCGELEDC